MAVIDANKLSKLIAKEVVKTLLPEVKKIVFNENKKLFKATRKAIVNEIKSLNENADQDSWYDEELEERPKNKPNGVLKNTKIAKEVIARGKSRARSLVDNLDLYGDSNEEPSVESLIESAGPEPEGAEVVEGADFSFRPTEKVDALDENVDINNINPANIDYSGFMDGLEEEYKLRNPGSHIE